MTANGPIGLNHNGLIVHARHVAVGDHDFLNAVPVDMVLGNENPVTLMDSRFFVGPTRTLRCPADAASARAPNYPGGAPGVAGNPDPVPARQPSPTAVVVRASAPGFLALPGPTVVRVRPGAVEIRSPASLTIGVRHPNCSIFVRRRPSTVGAQVLEMPTRIVGVHGLIVRRLAVAGLCGHNLLRRNTLLRRCLIAVVAVVAVIALLHIDWATARACQGEQPE